ncbi:response regulator [Puia sp. P3]|uniref:response regulator n=1 Tax=Puia sp. P3 TaxID=3423952 RepID=UPI003D66A873
MQNPKIILVDDDPDHLLVCKLIFERRNFQVHTLPGFNTLDDMIGQIKELEPHLIFMDHDMPGVKGDDAIKALKSSPETNHIPVIYFSGTHDIEELARLAGADAYIQKPFLIESLVALAHKYNLTAPKL